MVGKPELAPFGAELISTAVWRGVRVRDILALADGPRPMAQWVAVLAADEYTSALPLEAVLDPATLLVYEMNGEVLPREHGYPARLLLPDRYGIEEPQVGGRAAAAPARVPGLVRPAPVEQAGRGAHHVPHRHAGARRDAPVRPGPGGGYRLCRQPPVQRVEISQDGGQSWQAAELLDVPGPGEDRWVCWQAQVTLPGARATLVARATGGTGAVQTEAFALPQPDGGNGRPSVEVEVGGA